MAEFRVHTVPIVPFGSGGGSEFELAPRPKRGAARYPKRRKAGRDDVSMTIPSVRTVGLASWWLLCSLSEAHLTSTRRRVAMGNVRSRAQRARWLARVTRH